MTRLKSVLRRWMTGDISVSTLCLLDTNTVSLSLRGQAPGVVERLHATERADAAISIITAMEFRFGIAKNPATRVRQVVEAFLEVIAVLPLERNVEKVYGELRATLEKQGRPIGALDTIIAAHAIALGAVLVTNNRKEFRRVRGLRCEDWTGSA